jgi:oxygen-independent coproporphyrinogen III oxidase
MSIYIHIPFCKQACSYCDFYFSTNKNKKKEIVNAICKEIKNQKYFFDDTALEKIKTIYFGGGTPSILSDDELENILNAIRQNFNLSEQLEITLEANPDDINDEKLLFWKSVGVNRLSIGIQTFQEEFLKLMNRAHNSFEAKNVVQKAKNYGFNNFSLDLIYGIPNLSLEEWKYNLDIAISMGVNHLSCYALTVEKNTLLEHQIKAEKLKMPDEQDIAEQFELMVNFLSENDFEHYEISNFAKKGHYSNHNSAYWENKAYLGIGPSAHSYKNNWRKWNLANNHQYLKLINQGDFKKLYEEEFLSENDIYNEYIMTRIRTSKGISENEIEENFGEKYKLHFIKSLKSVDNSDFFIQKEKNLILNNKGKLMSDYIASTLFI